MFLYERDNITWESNHLIAFFSPLHVQNPHQSLISGQILLDTTAASRLKEWITSTTGAQLISVAGWRPNGHEPPPMSVLASICIDYAVTVNFPVISCLISRTTKEELREGHMWETQAPMSLTYALIRQLIEQLPT